jgi:hypothetical protein
MPTSSPGTRTFPARLYCTVRNELVGRLEFLEGARLHPARPARRPAQRENGRCVAPLLDGPIRADSGVCHAYECVNPDVTPSRRFRNPHQNRAPMSSA